MKNTYAVVALDVIGVLVRETKIVSRRLWEMLPNPKPIRREELKRRYDEELSLGATTTDEFWSGVVPAADREAFEAKFLGALAFDPEAAGAVERLSRQYRLAIVTDLPQRWGDTILELQGVRSWFADFVYGDSPGGNKKDGGAYRRLIECTGIEPGGVLVVDDSIENLRTAAAAGLDAVGFGVNQEGGFAWVSSFGSLLALLEGENRRV